MIYAIKLHYYSLFYELIKFLNFFIDLYTNNNSNLNFLKNKWIYLHLKHIFLMILFKVAFCDYVIIREKLLRLFIIK